MWIDEEDAAWIWVVEPYSVNLEQHYYLHEFAAGDLHFQSWLAVALSLCELAIRGSLKVPFVCDASVGKPLRYAL